MRERMGWGRLEVCDPLRSLQMSVCGLCWAGPASVVDMCREERQTNLNLQPQHSGCPRFPS